MEESKNLLARLKARNRTTKRPVIILSAHFDTFSANIPYNIQKILFFVFRIIILPYFLGNLIFFFLILGDVFAIGYSTQDINELVISFTVFEVIIVGMIFLLIYDNNKSCGSIDNASGVSILIELAKLFKNYPLENYDIIFLWTGAEEWGLKGSKGFVKKYKKYLKTKYDLDKSFNINIDMVGTYIGLENSNSTPYRKKNKYFDLLELIKKNADELDIPIIPYKKYIRPKTDHISFRSLAKKTKSKFQVACFHSDKDSKFIHSSKDTPDKCSSQNLNGCLEVCYNTIREIDSIY
jgi:hypothetical protein